MPGETRVVSRQRRQGAIHEGRDRVQTREKAAVGAAAGATVEVAAGLVRAVATVVGDTKLALQAATDVEAVVVVEEKADGRDAAVVAWPIGVRQAMLQCAMARLMEL